MVNLVPGTILWTRCRSTERSMFLGSSPVGTSFKIHKIIHQLNKSLNSITPFHWLKSKPLPQDSPAVSGFADQHTCSYQEPQSKDQWGTVLHQAAQIPIIKWNVRVQNKQRPGIATKDLRQAWGICSQERGTIAPPRPGRQGTSFVLWQFLHTRLT